MEPTAPSSSPTLVTSQKDLAPLLERLVTEGPVAVREQLATAHEADVAEALNALDHATAARILSSLPFEFAVRVVEQPELEARGAVFTHLATGTAVTLIRAMSPDQQVDLVRDLPETERLRVLQALDPPTRTALERLLAFDPTTAGGLMTTDYVSVSPAWTVSQALDHIRQTGRAPRPVYAVYVVDAEGRLVHVLSLRDLVTAEPTRGVTDVGHRRKIMTVAPSTDREDVARLLAKYNLLAVPVTDAAGRLLGTITVDDVIDAITKEQTEDVQKFGGMEALDEPYLRIQLGTMIRKRAGWLCALFLGEMLTATAMQHFEAQLSRALVLSLFIPLIMSSGGNSGSQATSLIIRALALREVGLRDWWRVVAREVPASLSLGCILAAIGAARITIWQMLGFYDYGPYWPLVAATVALALVGVVGFGSMVGSMLPFLLRALSFDPASASAPFVATLVDVTGLSIYFGVAYLVLRGTLL
jgi:magnesium transporter